MQSKKIILFLLLIIVLCTLSYYFVDQQLVWLLARHHSRDVYIFKIMANQIPNVVGAFVFLIYVFFAICFHTNLGKTYKKLLVMCNAIVTAIFLKDVLKPVFGRYWSATFICNNPSLIDNHVYGFNWFNEGTAFASFPSGHATLIFAFSISMWLLFPTGRWLWGLLAIMVVIGQI